MCQFHNRPQREVAPAANSWDKNLTSPNPNSAAYQAARQALISIFDERSIDCRHFKRGRDLACQRRQQFVLTITDALSSIVSQRISDLTPVIRAASDKGDKVDQIVKHRALEAIQEIRTLAEINRNLPRRADVGSIKKRFHYAIDASDAIWNTLTASDLESHTVQERALEALQTACDTATKNVA